MKGIVAIIAVFLFLSACKDTREDNETKPLIFSKEETSCIEQQKDVIEKASSKDINSVKKMLNFLLAQSDSPIPICTKH